MTDPKEELRKQAEEKLKKYSYDNPESLSKDDILHALEELRIHQIELEIQNEEMQIVQYELQKEKNRLSYLFHEAPISYLELDHTGLILNANNTFSTLLKTTPQEVANKYFSDFLSSESQKIFFSRYKSFYNNPENKNLTLEVGPFSKNENPPDTTFFMKMTGKQLSYLNNNFPVKSLLITLTDLTDLTLSEKKLSEQFKKNQDILNNTQDGIVMCDANLVIQTANNSFNKLFKFKPSETYGTPLLECFNFENSSQLQELLVLAKFSNSTKVKPSEQRRKIKGYSKDGSILTLKVSVSWFSTDNIDQYIIVFTDISTEETLEHQLRFSQKMESIATMASGIAHDFNNIFQGISLSTEALRHQLRDNQTIKNETGNIIELISRGNALVSQITKFSSHDTNSLSTFNINEMIKETTRLISLTTNKRIKILNSFEEKDLFIRGNFTQLQQAFINIINNAIQAMEEKGTILDISVSKSIYGNNIQITFQDEGHGIQPEYLDRIFDPFFTTKKENEVSGLGLSTSYGIITNMGGNITAKSNPGKGSTFTVTLPATPSPHSDEKQESKDESLHSKQLSILHVDDEEIQTTVLSELFHEYGHTTHTFNDPVKALEELPNLDFNIILADYNMPTMNGMDFVEAVRKNRPHIPAVILSGRAGILEHSTNKPDSISFLNKPVSINQLISTLNSMV